MQALENAKQLVGMLHVKAGTVIAEEINRFTSLAWLTADQNLGALFFCAEFPGIAGELLYQLVQQRQVTADDQVRLQLNLHAARRLALLQRGKGLLGQGAQIDGLHADAGARQARDRQHRAQQFVEVEHPQPYALQIVLAALGRALGQSAFEQPAKAVYGAERRAQIMRDRIGK